MKPNIFIISIGIAVLFIVGIILFLFFGGRRVSIVDIQEFQYRYVSSTALHGDTLYTLSCDQDKCVAGIKPKYISDEDKKEYVVQDDFCKKLEELLRKYHVGSWDGFHKSNKHVLDGSSFTLQLSTKKGDQVYARGYMKYPRKFREFSEELENLFLSLEK